jgi:hypothetical protein
VQALAGGGYAVWDSRDARGPGTPATAIAAAGGMIEDALLQLGLDDTVLAVVSPVEDVDLSVIRVEEDEEGVSEEFHLLDGFRLVHRKHHESLAPDRGLWLGIDGIELREVRRDRRGRLAGVCLLPAARNEDLLVTVTADLPSHAVDSLVDGDMRVAVFLFGTQDRASGLDRELRDDLFATGSILFGAKLELGIDDRLFDSFEFPYSVVDVVLETIGEPEVACLDLDVHRRSPFP